MARGAFFEVAGAVGFVGTEALASPTALNGLGRSPAPSCSLRALLPRLDTQRWPRTRDSSPAGPSKTRFPKPTTGQPSDVLFWRDLPTSSLCRTQQQSGAGPTARKLSMARLRAQEGARSSRRRAASEAGRCVVILSARADEANGRPDQGRGIAFAQNLAPPAVAHRVILSPHARSRSEPSRPGIQIGSEPEDYGVVTNTKQRPAAFGARHRRVPRTRSHAHLCLTASFNDGARSARPR
jgi:hypothetical protein